MGVGATASSLFPYIVTRDRGHTFTSPSPGISDTHLFHIRLTKPPTLPLSCSPTPPRTMSSRSNTLPVRALTPTRPPLPPPPPRLAHPNVQALSRDPIRSAAILPLPLTPSPRPPPRVIWHRINDPSSHHRWRGRSRLLDRGAISRPRLSRCRGPGQPDR